MPTSLQASGVRVLALGLLLLSGWIFGHRAAEAWRAAGIAPGVVQTSGCEEESMFALWRRTHGQAVYADPSQPPYASAYFNWLFYASYGVPGGSGLAADGAMGMIRAARLFTALGAVAGAASLVWLLTLAAPALPGPVRLALGGFAFAGPLIGWWGHTIRPDVWAIACETFAMAGFLHFHSRHPLRAALLAAAGTFLAWSFKPTYVCGAGAVLLLLAWRRDWRALSGFVLTWLVAVAATFLLMGPDYRLTFLATATTNRYTLAGGLGNGREFVIKFLPFLLPFVVLSIGRGRRDAPVGQRHADAGLLAWCGLLCSVPFCLATSCKAGAASNYYYSAALFLVLAGSVTWMQVRAGWAVMSALITALALQLAVATGRVGLINLGPPSAALAQDWEDWRREPEPRFSANLALNLPWLAPDSPPLVLGFNYWLDRDAGRAFADGGVGGLIRQGRFRSLLLPGDAAGYYDTGPLDCYVAAGKIGRMTVYRLRADPSPR